MNVIKSQVKIVPKELTRQQLIALVVQKRLAPYVIAKGMSKEALVEAVEAGLYVEETGCN